MQCIASWARAAIDRKQPFGNNYRKVLVCILQEAQRAIEVESEVKE